MAISPPLPFVISVFVTLISAPVRLRIISKRRNCRNLVNKQQHPRRAQRFQAPECPLPSTALLMDNHSSYKHTSIPMFGVLSWRLETTTAERSSRKTRVVRWQGMVSIGIVVELIDCDFGPGGVRKPMQAITQSSGNDNRCFRKTLVSMTLPGGGTSSP